MNEDEVKKTVREWQSYIGRRGGLSRSMAKRKALLENARKAREARAAKRKKGEGK